MQIVYAAVRLFKLTSYLPLLSIMYYESFGYYIFDI